MPPVVFRFGRDLRLDDHAGLAAAAEIGEILPVLVLDEPLIQRIGRSTRRAAFFCRAVQALDEALRARGARLIVRRGALAPTLVNLCKQTGATGVAWTAAYDAKCIERERALQSKLEESGLRAIAVHDAPAIPPEETAMQKASGGEGYRAFVPYVERWRELEPAKYEAPLLMRFSSNGTHSEAFPTVDDFGVTASEIHDATPEAALAQLAHFLELDAPQYALAVNVPADDRTSHLSAHLSFGTISARTVVRETRRRMSDPFLLTEERASLKKFLRALAQRDFFLQLSWFNPQTASEPLQEKMRAFPFRRAHPYLEAWNKGETGYPLVDAGIRQLHATGWMHPRVRAIAASFLCFDLGVDWRLGMAQWDRHFIEDDEALSIGNWQWIAGVGADLAAYPRIYNPAKQARRFDPHGAYASRWIPELAHRLPASARTAHHATLELPLYGTNTYPQPVVDHEREAREFLARYNVFVKKNPNAELLSVRQSNR